SVHRLQRSAEDRKPEEAAAAVLSGGARAHRIVEITARPCRACHLEFIFAGIHPAFADELLEAAMRLIVIVTVLVGIVAGPPSVYAQTTPATPETPQAQPAQPAE